jgi:predicted dehydrogenase
VNKTSYSRRRFLRHAVAVSGVAAIPSIVPATALGKNGSVAANERITLGFIGVGMMGSGHVRRFVGMPDTQVLAVCDVDRLRRENAQTAVQQHYAAQRSDANAGSCAEYNDFRELLERADIDAVVIATGDRWHVPIGVMAARAGKDIYCEKPLSLTIHEASVMTEVARRYGRVFQVGLQQRSIPVFHRACELVQDGRIGQIKNVYVAFPGTSYNIRLPAEPVPDGVDWDLWLGPAPWRPYNSSLHHYPRPRSVIPWNICRDFGGGNLTANAVHALDTVQWALGMDETGPVEITPPETGEVPSLTYRYANGIMLQVENTLDPKKHSIPKGWNPKARIQNFGALFVGEEGWIHVGRYGYLQSYPSGIAAAGGGFPKSHPIEKHYENWFSCIRTRQRPACDVAKGAHSVIVSHLGCIAHWTRRTLQWDPNTEEFIGNDEANRLRSRTMREPWML